MKVYAVLHGFDCEGSTLEFAHHDLAKVLDFLETKPRRWVEGAFVSVWNDGESVEREALALMAEHGTKPKDNPPRKRSRKGPFQAAIENYFREGGRLRDLAERRSLYEGLVKPRRSPPHGRFVIDDDKE